MQSTLTQKFRWVLALWKESDDPSVSAYRRHVRGLFIGWGITAGAMLALEAFPNEAKLTMYQMLANAELPWQQQWLSAVELSGPMVMAWHLNGLRLWGRKSVAPQR